MASERVPRDLIDTQEVARRVGSTAEAVRYWRKTGGPEGNPMPRGFKLGRAVRFSSSEIDAWIERMREVTV